MILLRPSESFDGNEAAVPISGNLVDTRGQVLTAHNTACDPVVCVLAAFAEFRYSAVGLLTEQWGDFGVHELSPFG